MKRLLLLLSTVLLFACCTAQDVKIPYPVTYLKWVHFKDTVRVKLVFQGTNDTLATQAYARGFAGGSLSAGIGIKVTGSTIAIDTGAFRKVDTLYTISDSLIGFKIYGRLLTFTYMNSFNGRHGDVTAQDNDYAQFYPKLDSTYHDPGFLATLNFAKLINLPQTLAGYQITNAIVNGGGAYQIIADIDINKPTAPTNGTFFLGLTTQQLSYWNGASWLPISGAGLDTVYQFNYGTISTRSGDTVKVQIDTTTLKTVFGSTSGGIFQLYQKRGLVINGTDTVSADTTYLMRYTDTLNGRIATRSWVATRGYLTSESDPVATAKTISIVGTANKGIAVAGTTAQSLGSNPSWTFTLDTTYAATLFALKDSSAVLRAAIGSGGGGISQVYNGYGTVIHNGDTIQVDTTLFPRYRDTLTGPLATRTYVQGRGYLTTETDPVATAKTIALNQGNGIVITGLTSQSIGSNPTYSFRSDTGYLSTLFALTDSVAILKSLIGSKQSTTYNAYGTIIHDGDSIAVDTTLFTRWKDTTAKLATQAFVTGKGYLTAETDPIALAKTITLNGTANRGIVVTGTAGQALSTSPTWALTADTTFLATNSYVNRQGFLKTETDPVALAKTVTATQGYGVVITGTAGQALSTNPSWVFKADTSVIAAKSYVAANYLPNTGSYHAYIRAANSTPASAGDTTYLSGHDSTLVVAGIVDSLNFHHALVNGRLVMYSTGGSGSISADTASIAQVLTAAGDSLKVNTTSVPAYLGTKVFIPAGSHTSVSLTTPAQNARIDSLIAVKYGAYHRLVRAPWTKDSLEFKGITFMDSTGNLKFSLVGDTTHGLLWNINASAYATTAAVTSTLSSYAPLASPALTGTPTAPTQTALTNNTDIATTAYTDGAVSTLSSSVTTSLAAKAPLASPTFTGTPAAPTATAGTNTTQLATTAFVTGALGSYALLASPTFTGVPAAPTATLGTNTTQLATTAFVQAAITSTGSGVTTVNPFSASSQTNGAAISGTTITFGPSDTTNPGMVTTGAQNIKGAKTFYGATTHNAVATFNQSLTAVGSAINLYENATPTAAWSHAMAVPGNSLTTDWYLSSYDGSTWTGRMHLYNTGKAQFMTYGTHTFTGTLAYGLGEDASGNMIELTKGTDFAPGTSANATGIVKSTTGTGALTTAVAADFPILNQATTSTAANLSGTPNLPNGTTATTQTNGDNSTKLATTAYVGTAVAAYAPLASPALTGTPTVPTAIASTNTTQAASTAFVQSVVSSYAPLASPALTGTPTAPTAANTTNTTQIASTAFVQNSIAGLAPLASPSLTGTPVAPTAASTTNTTQIATTAFVQSAIAVNNHGGYYAPTLTAVININLIIVNNAMYTVVDSIVRVSIYARIQAQNAGACLITFTNPLTASAINSFATTGGYADGAGTSIALAYTNSTTITNVSFVSAGGSGSGYNNLYIEYNYHL